MSINLEMLNQIREFFEDTEIDNEWMMDHISVTFDETTKTTKIEIWDINEQEYKWLEEAAT